MPDFPTATEFGKKIPKQKFYEYADVPAPVRRMFVGEIDSIVWRNKFSAEILNITAGQKVSEIELLHIVLRQKSLSAAVLGIITKAIPYHLVFLLEFAGEFQLRAAHTLDNGKQVWYESAWFPWEKLPLALDGLNLDAIYENFVRQIAGEELPETGSANLDEDVQLASAKAALQKRIAGLAKKVKTEKQFNRRAEYNRQLRLLKAELAALGNGGSNGQDEM